MRTIKFRGIDTMSSDMVYGDLIQQELTDGSITTAIVHTYATYDVKPKTVGQFTGLHDKNGKEIYEGDIVKHSSGFGGIITWNSHGYFYIMPEYRRNKEEQQYKPLGSMLEIEDFAIIGNIHDNPELMKGGEK